MISYFLAGNKSYDSHLSWHKFQPLNQISMQPVKPYLIDQIAKELGKSKQEVREEASRM